MCVLCRCLVFVVSLLFGCGSPRVVMLLVLVLLARCRCFVGALRPVFLACRRGRLLCSACLRRLLPVVGCVFVGCFWRVVLLRWVSCPLRLGCRFRRCCLRARGLVFCLCFGLGVCARRLVVVGRWVAEVSGWFFGRAPLSGLVFFLCVIENFRDVKILERKKKIGVTITWAKIRRAFLPRRRPKILAKIFPARRLVNLADQSALLTSKRDRKRTEERAPEGNHKKKE